MNWLTILAVAVGLAMDAFAVSIVAGLTVPRVTHRHVFRLAFHFGLFQFMMPVVGWLAGRAVADHMGVYDHWIAFGLLSAIGCKMLWDARSDGAAQSRGDPTRGPTLVLLSVATSIDALAVGVSMALLGVSVWLPSVVIGLVAAAMTVIGTRFGAWFGRSGGRWAGLVGGVVLIAIGVQILVSHLSGQP